MAYEISNYSLKITLVAGADLSSNAQYRFVKLNASGQAVLCNGTTDRAIGVLQNNPTATGEAEVVVQGGTKIVAGAAVAAGSLLSTDANGRAVAIVPGTDTTRYGFGTNLLAASAANDIITGVIDCTAAHRAT